MANKYLKKMGRTIGRWAVRDLSQDIAIDILAQLSLRLGISSVVANGDAGRFEGHPGDFVFQYYLREKDTYPELQRLIERVLGEGPGVYIDIGANIGLTLVPIARLGENACYGFEPEPENFALLEANIRANVPNAHVKLFNMALTTERAPLEFELNEDNRGDHRVRGESLIETEKFGESGRQIITVEGAPLDEIIDAESLAGPCVIKIDTQGSEVNVFRGGQKVFERADVVIAEFCPYLLLRMGTPVEEYFSFMRCFPFGAVMPDAVTNTVVLSPIDDIIAELESFVPLDGSAAKYLDLILARQKTL
jgi:FkbM family methyltransferase